LAAARHLRQADEHVSAGRWQDEWRIETPILSGKRLGILGMGTIGGKIAQRASGGFDMAVGYHNRRPVARSPHRYFQRLVDMAAWSDYLVVAAPGGAGTRHLVDASVLAALGPTGYLEIGRAHV